MKNAILVIKLRLTQILNALKGAGLVYIVLLFSLVFIFNLFIINTINQDKYNKYIIGGYLILILSIHLKRKDIFFLKITYTNYKYILFTEYFLLSVPLFFSLIYYNKWSYLSAGIIFIGLITNIKLKKTQYTLTTKIQKFIPNINYEWKAGIRKYFFIVITAYLIGLFGAPFPASVPISLFVIGLVLLSFYEQTEPLSMLLAFEFSSNKFIYSKIKSHFLLFSITVFPLILLFSIFYPEYWYIPVLEYLIFLSLHIFIIFSKYAYYEPTSNISGNQLMQMFASISLFIPIFIPVLWIFSAYIFFKAKTRLNFYLNDYN